MFFRNIIFFLVALVISIVTLCFCLEKLIFWARSEETIGEVIKTGSFAQYGYTGCRRSWSRTCYIAEISFKDSEEEVYLFEIDFRGSNKLTEGSPDLKYKQGQKISVIYSPNNPNRAYQKDLFWDKPINALCVTLIAWIFSMLTPSRD